VVLISGFNTGAAESEFRVLRKPCPPHELLQALREVTFGAGGHATPPR
jgi:hypothetical protein